MVTKERLSEALTRAREVLDTEKTWVKGVLRNGRQHCALGAIYVATDVDMNLMQRGKKTAAMAEGDRELCEALVLAVAQAVPEAYRSAFPLSNPRNSEYVITGFNDDPNTGWAMVVEAFEVAQNNINASAE